MAATKRRPLRAREKIKCGFEVRLAHVLGGEDCCSGGKLVQQVDLYVAIGKDGANLQRSAHSFNVAAQGAEVHVGALFEF